MDKEEFRIKLEEINRLVENKDYEGALEVVDSIDWRRVKNVRTLCIVGEIYAANKRYDDSREIFLLAYHRAPIGKNILNRLIDISLKMGDVEEAREYYEEFEQVAGDDSIRYILKYKIQTENKDPIEERIRTLEEYKEKEFVEKWSYELAKLYYQAGDMDKCLKVCDEMILWFNEGTYVMRAMELKDRMGKLTASEKQRLEDSKKPKEPTLVPIEAKKEEPAPAKEEEPPEEVAKEAVAEEAESEKAQSPASTMATLESEAFLGEEKAVAEEVPAGEESQSSAPAALEAESFLGEGMETALEEPQKEEAAPEEASQEVSEEVSEAPALEEAVKEVVEEAAEETPQEEPASQEDDILKEPTRKPSAELSDDLFDESLDEDSEGNAIESINLSNDKDFAGVESFQEKISKGIRDIFGTHREETPLSEEEDVITLPDEYITKLDSESSEEASEEDKEGSEEEAPQEAFDSEEEKSQEAPESEEEAKETEEPSQEEPEELIRTTSMDLEAKDFNLEDTILAAASLQGIEIPGDEPKKEEESAPKEEEEPVQTSSTIDRITSAVEKGKGFSGRMQVEDFDLEGSESEDPRDIDRQLEEEEFLTEEDLAEAEKEFLQGGRKKPDVYDEEQFDEMFRQQMEEDDALEDESSQEEEEEEEDEEPAEEKPALRDRLKDRFKGGHLLFGGRGDDEDEEEEGEEEGDEEEEDELDSSKEEEYEQDEEEEEEEEDEDEEEPVDEESRQQELQEFLDSLKVGFDPIEIVPRERVLTEEEVRLFSYFVKIPGMKEQLVDTLCHVQEAASDKTSSYGNIIVMGGKESGKTRLISALIPAICSELNLEATRVAYVFAEDINGKDMSAILQKLAGGFLVIEGANQLDQQTANSLNEGMEQNTDGLIVILEDEKIGMRKMIARYPKLARKFTTMINIPIFTNDELVNFAVVYTLENGYRIDQMGMLALYNQIGESQKEDEPMNIGSVKRILDEAFARAEGGILKINRKKRVDKDGYVVLHEKDFG